MQHSPPEPSGRMRFSIGARLRSVVFALRGLRSLVRYEHNARVHAAASAFAVCTGVLLRISASDWRWIITAIAVVWATEAINTAIEHLCDRVSPQFDPVIGRVKDLAAGAVLVVSIAAALVGLLTFAPPLFQRLS